MFREVLISGLMFFGSHANDSVLHTIVYEDIRVDSIHDSEFFEMLLLSCCWSAQFGMVDVTTRSFENGDYNIWIHSCKVDCSVGATVCRENDSCCIEFFGDDDSDRFDEFKRCIESCLGVLHSPEELT